MTKMIPQYILEREILRWWRARRPMGWSAVMHTTHPCVNAFTPCDAGLAKYAARLERRRIEDRRKP